MRSLFVRIFLSYWVAQALFLVLAILVTLAIRPSGEIASVQAQQAKFLNEAVQAYQDRRRRRSAEVSERSSRLATCPAVSF